MPPYYRDSRHILVRRCPRTNNFDDIRITISDGTTTPDRVDTFALLYLSPHVSPRLPASVEGGRK
jgi:hypothetical protein